MLSLLMRGLKEEDGTRRSSLYSELRFIENREMSRASKSNTRGMEEFGRINSLFEVDRENELARA